MLGQPAARRAAAAALVLVALGSATARAADPEVPAPQLESIVTVPSSAGASDPLLAVDDHNIVYAAAPLAGRGAVWRDSGGGFSRAALGGLLSNLPGGPVTGLALDAAGDVHLAAPTATGVTVLRSIDGGTAVDRGTAVAAPTPMSSSRPMLAAGRFTSGVEGATLTLATPTAAGLVVSRSLDGGLTFPQQVPAVAAASCPGCAERTGGVVVDPTDDTRVWIAHSGPQGVRVLTSNDGARTFTIRTISSAANVDAAPAISRAADGLLAVAWSDAVATRISTSADGGATWTVSTPVGPPAAAVAVAVARSGRLAVGFTSPQGRAVTVSPDGGKHFSAPLALSDGAAAGRVSVVADNSGRWLVAWATQAGIQLARLTATPPST